LREISALHMMRRAKAVAEVLLRHHATDVFLFGSLARGESTVRDLDMIATIDWYTFSDWYYECFTGQLDYENRQGRNELVCQELQIDREGDLFTARNGGVSLQIEVEAILREEEILYPTDFELREMELLCLELAPRLDLFLFPEEWLDRLDYLQGLFDHNDPEFMYKISRNVRLYYRHHRCFEPHTLSLDSRAERRLMMAS
jgi:predicted nucleotidyltransferase